MFFRREKGTYYALHLGGTNFRVLRVHLGDQRSAILGQDIARQPIPQHLMTSTSEVAEFEPLMFCYLSAINKITFDLVEINIVFIPFPVIMCRISLISLRHH